MWVVFGSCSSKGIQRKKQGSVGTKIKLCSVSRSPAGCVFNQEGWILRMRGKDFGRCGVRCGMVVSFSFFVRYFYAASTGGVRKQNKSLSAWAIRISKGGYIEMIHGWLFLKHWRNEYPSLPFETCMYPGLKAGRNWRRQKAHSYSLILSHNIL